MIQFIEANSQEYFVISEAKSELYWDNHKTHEVHRRYNANNQLHSENEPAILIFETGREKPIAEFWFRNDKLHRECGPAVVIFHSDSFFSYHEHGWYQNGLRHRENAPSLIKYSSSPTPQTLHEEWRQHDRPHRIGGPAIWHLEPETGVVTFELWSTFNNVGAPQATIERDAVSGLVTIYDSEETNIGGPRSLPQYDPR